MTGSRVRVSLVDDHQLIVESFSALLQLDDRIEIVGTAFTAEEGGRLVEELRPDVAVFDVDFPGRDSFDVVPQLVSGCPQTRFIFLTAHVSDVFVSQAVRLGARGYLLKEEPALVVRDSILRVANGEYAFSSAVRDRLIWDDKTQSYDVRTDSMLCGLSIQQLSILRHLARGESVKQIAAQLGRSEKSIDSHKYRIMHRLGIHDRVELARYAIREGLTLV
ncbi:MAG: response regulator transcription factor [Planctomycetota bacterium]|jgi:DNA-binding NarL/FixJ family response regulator